MKTPISLPIKVIGTFWYTVGYSAFIWVLSVLFKHLELPSIWSWIVGIALALLFVVTLLFIWVVFPTRKLTKNKIETEE